jgi:hypothetical protein
VEASSNTSNGEGDESPEGGGECHVDEQAEREATGPAGNASGVGGKSSDGLERTERVKAEEGDDRDGDGVPDESSDERGLVSTSRDGHRCSRRGLARASIGCVEIVNTRHRNPGTARVS